MSTFRWLSALIVAIVLVSCANAGDILENFDSKAWAKDRNACSGQRKAQIEIVLKQKSRLLGLNELEMIDVLGKPDQQEIYKRNQKFYYYFLDPARSCSNAVLSPERLSVRFNAVGLSKEISVEQQN